MPGHVNNFYGSYMLRISIGIQDLRLTRKLTEGSWAENSMCFMINLIY